jgi:hypothetical protein
MALKYDTTMNIRTTKKWVQQLTKAAKERNTNKTDLIKELVNKGLNERDTYPLEKFLHVAPETKCFYVIMVPGEGETRAKVLKFGVADNLFRELCSLSELREFVQMQADVMFWEVQ